jgi:4-hydroxy-tetrahydrodipicolinate reductase
MAVGGGAMVYGANFSIGVHIFYRLVDRAGELFRGLAAYDAFIEEAHHAAKRDAPSGTALEAAALLARRLDGRKVPIASTRAGHIPGVHRVGFDSAADQVTVTHTARSRDGFAAGALAAARWIVGRRGVYAFGDVLDQILEAERGKP